MIFTITPLVQEAKTKRQWLRTFGIFTAALVLVLGAFGAAMAWAGAAVAAKVTTPWAREAIASIALTVVGVLALVVALGELGVIRPLLPQVRTVPTGPGTSSLSRRALIIALAFGATMAIFSPLSAYAVTLMAYGLGLVVPLRRRHADGARRPPDPGLAGTCEAGGRCRSRRRWRLHALDVDAARDLGPLLHARLAQRATHLRAPPRLRPGARRLRAPRARDARRRANHDRRHQRLARPDRAGQRRRGRSDAPGWRRRRAQGLLQRRARDESRRHAGGHGRRRVRRHAAAVGVLRRRPRRAGREPDGHRRRYAGQSQLRPGRWPPARADGARPLP